jgi:hypothetical protein
MMNQNRLSVSEALKRIESGQSIEGYSVDFERIKVEALDVMKLVKNGVEVPEDAIYYDDEDIIDDEDFDGSWEMIDYDPLEGPPNITEVRINLDSEVKSWLDKRDIKLDQLVEQLLNGFYSAHRMVKDQK